MPLGDEYNPRTTTLLSGAYDLGLAEESLPSSLKLNDDTKVDIDHAKYGLRVEDVGDSVLRSQDTWCYQRPAMRRLDLPANTKPLFLTRGPGVTYVLVEADREEVRSGRTTVEAEVKKARDDIVEEICRLAPSVALRTSTSPDLICRSHQMATGRLLRQVLTRLGYQVVWHVQWGMKCDVEALKALDEAAAKASGLINPGGDATKSNLFDVATTYKTEGVPLVSSWPVCRAPGGDDHGDKLAQPNATAMRCYPQAPGIFRRPFGSTQTRNGTPWPDVKKLTLYNKKEHANRCHGLFHWVHPKKVQRGQANLKYLRGVHDFLATPEGMTHLEKHGLGLRVEARVLATTASEAVGKVQNLGILDPATAWKGMGQFQVETSDDGRSTTTYLPVWVISPEVFVANGMRVTQAAREVIRGRGGKEVTAEMSQANVDAFAAAGHTDKGRRASTGFTCGASFWVHDVEKKRDEKVGARRSNPSRSARKPAIRELSSREVHTGDITPRDSGAGEGNPSGNAPSNTTRESAGDDANGGGGPERTGRGVRPDSRRRRSNRLRAEGSPNPDTPQPGPNPDEDGARLYAREGSSQPEPQPGADPVDEEPDPTDDDDEGQPGDLGGPVEFGGGFEEDDDLDVGGGGRVRRG